MKNNDFFYTDDRIMDKVGKFRLPKGWWSRPYEYDWANRHNLINGIVADMGAGYTYRPFTDLLSMFAAEVYRVDGNRKLLTVPCKDKDKVATVVADFTQEIVSLSSDTFDRIFYISVLEDVGNKIPLALREFKRLLKPDGKIVLTFDVPIREDPIWPGVDLNLFFDVVSDVGLKFVGNEPENNFNEFRELLVNKEFGLTCYHCILEK